MSPKIPMLYAKDGHMTYMMEFINHKQAILTIENNKSGRRFKEIWVLAEAKRPL